MSIAPAELAAGRERYTYEDYCRLPEGSPYQLIGGETGNDTVAYTLSLDDIHEIGITDGGLCPGERAQLAIIEEKRIKGAPDLVVEILAPGTGYYDLRSKYKVYEKSGVREYWIVDPQQKSVQVFCLQEGKFTLDQEVEQQGAVKSRVIAGLEVRVESIF
ncbi:Nuclease, putative, TT1808 [Moorella glycerini]|uniref:Putative restriction endonuclease domain-containing protein n=1 Tax=Neomoorella stamsii TaxID=1266720 RepID=A0A9X7P7L5_9FIRM|nr:MULTISPECIES: Uma2 family endonuclease [Moorella]PRR77175.1 hypothetical protein MOST_03030 [Moorella stamsii]CEP67249.1 Nuclease, putative, TT1808 [Moorella glycerini]